MNKILVVYFSYTGNTRKIANLIKDKLPCDILELKPVIAYNTDYQTVVDEEQKMEGANHMPEIKDINVDLSLYETIIIGTPVWWYTISPVIRTFLNKYDLSGKNIYFFATNAGWLGKTFIELQKECKGNVISSQNIVFESYSDKLITKQDEINNWIMGIR